MKIKQRFREKNNSVKEEKTFRTLCTAIKLDVAHRYFRKKSPNKQKGTPPFESP
jgi:hypothetical protein